MSVSLAPPQISCNPSGGVVTLIFTAQPAELVTYLIKKDGTNLYGGNSGSPVTEYQTDHASLVNGLYTIEYWGDVTPGHIEAFMEIDCNNAPICDLSFLGQPTVTHDQNGAGVGKITLNASSSFPIEYSKDNINWQSANVLTGYTAGTYMAYIRDSNNCSTSYPNIVVNNGPCAFDFTYSKTDETGIDLNNGTISAQHLVTTGAPMYSLGGPFQSNPNFTNLPPGVYTLTGRDSATGCQKALNVTIVEYTVPEVPPIPACFNPDVFFSDANPIRFIKDLCNDADETEKLFNDEDNCGKDGGCFFQPINCDDVLTFQYRYSDFVNNTIPSVKIREWSTKAILYDIPSTHLGSGAYKVERNLNIYADLCGKEVYLTISSYSPVHAVDLYTHAESEPLHISNYHNCNLLLEYWNNSDYRGIKYEGTGYINKLRIEASLDIDEFPQQTEIYVKSNGERVKLFEEVNESWLFEVNYCPPYLHKIIALALSHDNVRIGNNLLIKEEPYSFNRIEKYALMRGSGKLLTRNYQSKNLIK